MLAIREARGYKSLGGDEQDALGGKRTLMRSPTILFLMSLAVLMIGAARAAAEEPDPPQDHRTPEADAGSGIGDAPDGGLVGSITFANGDHMRSHVVALREGELAFRLAAAPQTVLRVERARIAAIAFAEVPADAPPEAEELRLRDGSVLYGKFVKFTEVALHFDAQEIGLVELPRNELKRLSKSGHAAVDARPPAEHPVMIVRGHALAPGDSPLYYATARQANKTGTVVRPGEPSIVRLLWHCQSDSGRCSEGSCRFRVPQATRSSSPPWPLPDTC